MTKKRNNHTPEAKIRTFEREGKYIYYRLQDLVLSI